MCVFALSFTLVYLYLYTRSHDDPWDFVCTELSNVPVLKSTCTHIVCYFPFIWMYLRLNTPKRKPYTWQHQHQWHQKHYIHLFSSSFSSRFDESFVHFGRWFWALASLSLCSWTMLTRKFMMLLFSSYALHLFNYLLRCSFVHLLVSHLWRYIRPYIPRGIKKKETWSEWVYFVGKTFLFTILLQSLP